MLASLDALIAFALIFTVVSLLITTGVQIISATLNLRGWNLFHGLTKTLKTINPDLVDSTAKPLAKKLLNDSFLSDNASALWTRFPNAVRAQEMFDRIVRLSGDDEVKKLLTNLGITDIVGATKEEVEKAYQKFEQWFETGQERAQQWFTTHTGYATYALAVIAAFCLQLDAGEIFRTASSPEVTKKLAEKTTKVQALADKVQATQPVLEKALETWRNDPDNKAFKDKTKDVKVVPDATRKTLAADLQKAINAQPTAADADAAIQRFNIAVDAETQTAMEEGANTLKDLAAVLDGRGFELLPPEGGRWGKGWWWTQIGWSHIFGEVFAMLLLSLGSPFWFNTLKQLTSLRPLVQGHIAKEKEEDQKKDEPAKAGKPPATAINPSSNTITGGALAPCP